MQIFSLIYNTVLVFCLIVRILYPVLYGQCWPPDCDDGRNQLELMHGVHHFDIETVAPGHSVDCFPVSLFPLLLYV